MNQQLSKNFYLNEFLVSNTAAEHGIDNTPPIEAINNLDRLCDEVLQPLRDFVNAPIIVTSGFRSPKLNRRVSGEINSVHLTGRAADIYSTEKTARQIMLLLKESAIAFDRAAEYPTFVHIEVPKENTRPRRLFFKAIRNRWVSWS